MTPPDPLIVYGKSLLLGAFGASFPRNLRVYIYSNSIINSLVLFLRADLVTPALFIYIILYFIFFMI